MSETKKRKTEKLTLLKFKLRFNGNYHIRIEGPGKMRDYNESINKALSEANKRLAQVLKKIGGHKSDVAKVYSIKFEKMEEEKK